MLIVLFVGCASRSGWVKFLPMPSNVYTARTPDVIKLAHVL